MRVSGLRRCDERTHVNTCINKSLFQALESSPVVLLVSHRLNCFADIFSVFSVYYFTIFHPTCCSVNHSTFSRGNLMAYTNVYMDSQKLDTILREPCGVHCYYSSASVPKMSSEAISENLITKNFLGEHAPRAPPSLACIHVTHPCNPPCKNPGYRPDTT